MRVTATVLVVVMVIVINRVIATVIVTVLAIAIANVDIVKHIVMVIALRDCEPYPHGRFPAPTVSGAHACAGSAS